MTDWEVVRHRVTLAGRVTNRKTGGRQRDASVHLVKMPHAWRLRVDALRRMGVALRALRRPADRTRTAADGSFFFLDLPPGLYEVTAEVGDGLSRRRAETVPVELTDDGGAAPPVQYVKLILSES